MSEQNEPVVLVDHGDYCTARDERGYTFSAPVNNDGVVTCPDVRGTPHHAPRTPLVYRNGDQRIAAPRLYLNTTKLEEAVTLDPAGLGLSTLANTYANKKVKALAIEGVVPSTQSVTDGSYPLFITLYTVTRPDSPGM